MLRTSVSVSGARGRVRAVVVMLAGVLVVLGGDVSGAAAATVDLRLPDTASGRPGATTVLAREVVGLRTAESNTYEMPNGDRLARVYAAPVNYRDGHGDWQRIDDELVDTGTGRLGNAANRFDVGLPARMEDGPVRVTHGSASVSFSLEGAHGVGTVDGATESFEGALPDTRVQYESTDTGVKETLVVYGNDAPREFRFRVNVGDGLVARERRGGRVDVVDADGDVRFTLAQPVMWDADDASPSMHAVDAAVEHNADGSLELVYTPDAAWVAARLADGHRVAIDPTTSVGPAPDCTLDKGAPTTSDCASTLLKVGAANGTDHHGLLKFDVKSVIPKDVEITLAWLETTLASTLNTADEQVGIYNVTHSWTSSATWNTYDGTNAWTAGGETAASPERSQTVWAGSLGTFWWHVTSLAKKWVSGAQAQNGVMLKQTSASATNELRFDSNEAASGKPVFDVQYSKRTGSVKGLQQDTQAISDRSSVSVELSGGNMLYSANDVHIAGTAGLDFNLTRVYNSEESFGEEMSFGWRLEPVDTELSIAGAGGNVQWVGPDGARRTFERKPGSTQGSIDEYASPMGIDATLQAKGSDLHTYELVFNQSKEKWTYTGCGNGCDLNLVSIEDRTGANKISFTYDAANAERWKDATDTQGRTITPTYTSGNITAIVVRGPSPDGGITPGPVLRTYGYAYNANGKMISYTDPATKVTTYGYEPTGNLDTMTSAEGRVTKITYVNPSGLDDRVAKVVRGTGTDANGNPTGPTTSYCYQSPSSSDTTDCAAFSASTCPTGSDTESQAHPTIGGTEVTDPLGNLTKYCWDSDGRITKVTDAKSHDVTAIYTANNDPDITTAGKTGDPEPQSVTDADYKTDGTNNLSKVTQPAGGTWNLTYGTPDASPALKYQPQKVTNPQGTDRNLSYDSSGLLSKATDSSSPLANQAQLEWNSGTSGPLCGADTGPKGTLRCAIPGGLTARKTLYSYTGGNLTQITPPTITTSGMTLLGATRLTYDPLSHVDKLRDGNTPDTGNPTEDIDYDGLDRPTLITYRDGSTISFVYDADGNLTSRADSVNGTSSYTYDKLNRLTREAHPGGRAEDYTYDNNSNTLTQTDTVAGVAKTTTYAYDATDRLKSVAEPSGNCNIAPSVLCTTYGYDSHDRRKSITYPNGVAITQTFDTDDKVKTIVAAKGSTLASRTYSYDRGTTPTDLRTSVTDETGRKTVYTYDGLDRLDVADVQSSSGTTIRKYDPTYDATSNITSMDGTGITTYKYAYNEANQLCWKATTANAGSNTACSTKPTTRTDYGYDANGNLTSISGGGAFSYNIRNQTTSITPPGGSAASLGYLGPDQDELIADAGATLNNSRYGVAARTAGGTPTYFVRDTSGNVISQRTGSTAYYPINDALGSPIALTTSTGTVASTYDYEPFGKLVNTPSVTDQIGFAGGMTVGASGTMKLLHFGKRYYDPDNGRWTQPDALDSPSDLREANRYLYVGQDPIDLVDPAGTYGRYSSCSAGPVSYNKSRNLTGDSYGRTHTSRSVGLGFGRGAGGCTKGNFTGESDPGHNLTVGANFCAVKCVGVNSDTGVSWSTKGIAFSVGVEMDFSLDVF